MFTLNGKYTTASIYTDNLEESAVSQIINLLNSPMCEDSQVAIMPDVHAGIGCTIGTTVSIRSGRVVPNIVGVDIGCGMLTVKLPFKKIDFEKFDNVVHSLVPAGFEVNDRVLVDYGYLERLDCFNKLREVDRIKKSCGSLGGGNHFIEIDKSDDGELYLIIHSGSRNLGKQVCTYYQDLAFKRYEEKYQLSKEEKYAIINDLKSQGRQIEIQEALMSATKEKRGTMPKINKDLCFLEGTDYLNYLGDMKLCQKFASLNRKTIADNILLTYCGLSLSSLKWFETVHNYIDVDTAGPVILRKGAVSAKKNELLLIPINMRDGSLLCVGNGNPNWNFSAPHGAGRVMSRAAAKEKISLKEFSESMKGVYTSCVGIETIDESPMAYRNIYDIVSNISETVTVIKRLKPIYNYKGK